ncbi:MAG: response regulator, partial [Candidatus Omnitrophica bacterium]|nr:response regulator [Candidatus Omnitrophota bacterium]
FSAEVIDASSLAGAHRVKIMDDLRHLIAPFNGELREEGENNSRIIVTLPLKESIVEESPISGSPDIQVPANPITGSPAIKPWQPQDAVSAGSESLINNPFMTNILKRYPKFAGPIAGFLKRDHPLKIEIFGEIDRMPQEEIIHEIEEIIRLSSPERPGSFAFVESLSVREIFLRPTVGGNDIPQAFRSLPTMNEAIERLGRSEVLPDMRSCYLLIRALDILSKDRDFVLYTGEDLKDEDSLLQYLLSNNVVLPPYLTGGQETTVPSETAEKLLSFGLLLIEMAIGQDPRQLQEPLNSDALRERLLQDDKTAIRESIKNFLALLDALQEKSEAWKKELARVLSEDETTRKRYQEAVDILRKALISPWKPEDGLPSAQDSTKTWSWVKEKEEAIERIHHEISGQWVQGIIADLDIIEKSFPNALPAAQMQLLIKFLQQCQQAYDDYITLFDQWKQSDLDAVSLDELHSMICRELSALEKLRDTAEEIYSEVNRMLEQSSFYLEQSDNAKVKQILENVIFYADMLGGLIDKCVFNIRRKPRPVNLAEFFREHSFSARLSSEPVDPSLCAQMVQVEIIGSVLNFIRNAKYHGEAKKIIIRVYSEGGFAVIEVKNDGEVIPPELIDETNKRPLGGTSEWKDELVLPIFSYGVTTGDTKGEKHSGLGLAIAWEDIVHYNNGKITVTSKPGETVFRIYLPLAEAESENKTYIQSTQERYGDRNHIRNLQYEYRRKEFGIPEEFKAEMISECQKERGVIAFLERPRQGYVRFFSVKVIQRWAKRIYEILPFIFQDGLTFNFIEFPEGVNRRAPISLSSALDSDAKLLSEIIFADQVFSDALAVMGMIFRELGFEQRSPLAAKEIYKNFLQGGFYHEIGHAIYNVLPAHLKRRFQNVYQRSGFIYEIRLREALKDKGVEWAPGSKLQDELFADKFSLFVFPEWVLGKNEPLSDRERQFMQEVISYLGEKHASGKNVFLVEDQAVKQGVPFDDYLSPAQKRGGRDIDWQERANSTQRKGRLINKVSKIIFWTSVVPFEIIECLHIFKFMSIRGMVVPTFVSSFTDTCYSILNRMHPHIIGFWLLYNSPSFFGSIFLMPIIMWITIELLELPLYILLSHNKLKVNRRQLEYLSALVSFLAVVLLVSLSSEIIQASFYAKTFGHYQFDWVDFWGSIIGSFIGGALALFKYKSAEPTYISDLSGEDFRLGGRDIDWQKRACPPTLLWRAAQQTEDRLIPLADIQEYQRRLHDGYRSLHTVRIKQGYFSEEINLVPCDERELMLFVRSKATPADLESRSRILQEQFGEFVQNRVVVVLEATYKGEQSSKQRVDEFENIVVEIAKPLKKNVRAVEIDYRNEENRARRFLPNEVAAIRDNVTYLVERLYPELPSDKKQEKIEQAVSAFRIFTNVTESSNMDFDENGNLLPNWLISRGTYEVVSPEATVHIVHEAYHYFDELSENTPLASTVDLISIAERYGLDFVKEVPLGYPECFWKGIELVKGSKDPRYWNRCVIRTGRKYLLKDIFRGVNLLIWPFSLLMNLLMAFHRMMGTKGGRQKRLFNLLYQLKVPFTENALHYSRGYMLGGIAYQFAQETGNMDDAWKLVRLLGQGLSLPEAVDVIRPRDVSAPPAPAGKKDSALVVTSIGDAFSDVYLARDGTVKNVVLGGCSANLVTNFTVLAAQDSAEALLIGGIGNDTYAASHLSFCQERGINTAGLFTIPNYHCGSVKISFGYDDSYNFEFEPGASVMVSEKHVDSLKTALEKTRFLHFGLASLFPDRPIEQATKKAVSYAANAGAIIYFDVNARLSTWAKCLGSREASEAKTAEAIQWALPQADIIKMNKRELIFINRTDCAKSREDYRPDSAIEEMRKFVSRYAGLKWQVFVVTSGEKGCYYVLRTKNHDFQYGYVPAYREWPEVGTIGAGDAFNAAVIYDLYRILQAEDKQLRGISKAELRAVLEFASKVAAKVVAQESTVLEKDGFSLAPLGSPADVFVAGEGNKYELFVFDVDDNLIKVGEKISPEALQMLINILEYGGRIAILSGGRMECSAAGWGVKSRLVNHIPEDIRKRYYDRFIFLTEAGGRIYQFDQNGNLYLDENLSQKLTDRQTQAIRRAIDEIVGPLKEYFEIAVRLSGISLDFTAPVKERVPELTRRLREALAGENLHVNYSSIAIDITVEEKAGALQKLAARLEIPLIKVVVSGDSANDLAMLNLPGVVAIFSGEDLSIMDVNGFADLRERVIQCHGPPGLVEVINSLLKNSFPAPLEMPSDSPKAFLTGHGVPKNCVGTMRSSQAECTYSDLLAEGYRFEVVEEIDWDFGVPRKTVKIWFNGEEVIGANVTFLVIAQFKTIVIERVYPKFPNQRNGRGRALLRQLLIRPEYAGYHVVALGLEPFKKSFSKMYEFSPIIGYSEIYPRVARSMLCELNKLRPETKIEFQLIKYLKEIWSYANLYGVVPEVSAVSDIPIPASAETSPAPQEEETGNPASGQAGIISGKCLMLGLLFSLAGLIFLGFGWEHLAQVLKGISINGPQVDFAVSAPFIHSLASVPIVAAVGSSLKLSSRHIVLIEDNPQELKLYTNELRQRGFRVSGFSSAEDAIEYLVKHKGKKLPDAILCDMYLGTKQSRGDVVSREIRRRGFSLPIFLQAKNSRHYSSVKIAENSEGDERVSIHNKKDRQKTYARIEERIAIENYNRVNPPKEKPARVGTGNCCVFDRRTGRYPPSGEESSDGSVTLYCGFPLDKLWARIKSQRAKIIPIFSLALAATAVLAIDQYLKAYFSVSGPVLRLVPLTVAASLFLIGFYTFYFLLVVKAEKKFTRQIFESAVLGLIIGAALGNLHDFFLLGKIRDVFEITGAVIPFNFADIVLVTSVIIALVFDTARAFLLRSAKGFGGFILRFGGMLAIMWGMNCMLIDWKILSELSRLLFTDITWAQLRIIGYCVLSAGIILSYFGMLTLSTKTSDEIDRHTFSGHDFGQTHKPWQVRLTVFLLEVGSIFIGSAAKGFGLFRRQQKPQPTEPDVEKPTASEEPTTPPAEIPQQPPAPETFSRELIAGLHRTLWSKSISMSPEELAAKLISSPEFQEGKITAAKPEIKPFLEAALRALKSKKPLYRETAIALLKIIEPHFSDKLRAKIFMPMAQESGVWDIVEAEVLGIHRPEPTVITPAPEPAPTPEPKKTETPAKVVVPEPTLSTKEKFCATIRHMIDSSVKTGDSEKLNSARRRLNQARDEGWRGIEISNREAEPFLQEIEKAFSVMDEEAKHIAEIVSAEVGVKTNLESARRATTKGQANKALAEAEKYLQELSKLKPGHSGIDQFKKDITSERERAASLSEWLPPPAPAQPAEVDELVRPLIYPGTEAAWRFQRSDTSSRRQEPISRVPVVLSVNDEAALKSVRIIEEELRLFFAGLGNRNDLTSAFVHLENARREGNKILDLIRSGWTPHPEIKFEVASTLRGLADALAGGKKFRDEVNEGKYLSPDKKERLMDAKKILEAAKKIEPGDFGRRDQEILDWATGVLASALSFVHADRYMQEDAENVLRWMFDYERARDSGDTYMAREHLDSITLIGEGLLEAVESGSVHPLNLTLVEGALFGIGKILRERGELSDGQRYTDAARKLIAENEPSRRAAPQRADSAGAPQRVGEENRAAEAVREMDEALRQAKDALNTEGLAAYDAVRREMLLIYGRDSRYLPTAFHSIYDLLLLTLYRKGSKEYALRLIDQARKDLAAPSQKTEVVRRKPASPDDNKAKEKIAEINRIVESQIARLPTNPTKDDLRKLLEEIRNIILDEDADWYKATARKLAVLRVRCGFLTGEQQGNLALLAYALIVS